MSMTTELAQLTPAGKFMFEACGQRWHHIKHGEAQYTEPRLTMVKLYQESDVLELVEALEAKEQQRAAANKVVNQQDIELQELRQHIAELEARTVKLPAAWWVKQGGQSLLAYEKQMLLDALAAAGISVAVEGE